MADQETFVANAAESTLSSSLAQAATSVNVTSTTGFPSVPFYATIDPDDDSKREVVKATAKTATTLTVARGEDGTSDVAHDSGATIAVVPVAALWTDINDRVEGHTHSGSTDGAAVATGDLSGHDKAAHDALSLDHGSLSGKSDVADHPQYVHATAQVKETGGGQSIPAGTETTLNLDETDWSANCTLASNALTVTYGGTYLIYATVQGSSSSDASSGTIRVKKNSSTTLASDSMATAAAAGGPRGTIGTKENFGTGVEVATLADGDDLTVTVELTGGSGHSTTSVHLAAERIG